MLKQEGRWYSLGARLRVYRKVMEFVFKAGPAMLKAFAPNYHPSQVSDPEWVDEWIAAYSSEEVETIPLLNTNTATILPVFAN